MARALTTGGRKKTDKQKEKKRKKSAPVADTQAWTYMREETVGEREELALCAWQCVCCRLVL